MRSYPKCHTYVQVKRSIKKSIRSKFIRPLTLVLIFWERKVIAEPFFWGSVGDEFNSSFKIYHTGMHPAAAFHRSWKKFNQKVAKKRSCSDFYQNLGVEARLKKSLTLWAINLS